MNNQPVHQHRCRPAVRPTCCRTLPTHRPPDRGGPRDRTDRRPCAARALGARHAADLLLAASVSLSAAVDELTDPLTLPELPAVDEHATRDPVTVLTAVADRLSAAASTAPDVRTAMASGRAVRELRAALRALDPAQAQR